MTIAPNPIDRRVGAKVRMRRLHMGMTLEKLAEAIGVSFQQIQKYENGTNRVGASRLHQLSDALNVSPTFFFDETSADGGGGSASPPVFSEDEAFLADVLATGEGVDLNRAFGRIADPQLRKKVVDLVISLAASSEEAKGLPKLEPQPGPERDGVKRRRQTWRARQLSRRRAASRRPPTKSGG